VTDLVTTGNPLRILALLNISEGFWFPSLIDTDKIPH
jgi:hypothetical protein